MVVLSDNETWTGLGGCKLVFVPKTPEGDEALASGEDANHYIYKLVYDEKSGIFDLEKLIMDLPASTLERYRVK
jgi:hypothetical protein